MKEFNFSHFDLQDIKTNPLTETQLQELKELAGSYSSLFSRNSTKYKELNLKEKQLTEQDYKNYLLSHYTFLKRPVIVDEGRIFIGNDKRIPEFFSNQKGSLS